MAWSRHLVLKWTIILSVRQCEHGPLQGSVYGDQWRGEQGVPCCKFYKWDTEEMRTTE